LIFWRPLRFGGPRRAYCAYMYTLQVNAPLMLPLLNGLLGAIEYNLYGSIVQIYSSPKCSYLPQHLQGKKFYLWAPSILYLKNPISLSVQIYTESRYKMYSIAPKLSSMQIYTKSQYNLYSITRKSILVQIYTMCQCHYTQFSQ